MLGEVFEQFDLAALGPVDVLEHEDGRLREGRALDESSRGEEQQPSLRDIVIGSQAEEKRKATHCLGRLCFRHERLYCDAELLSGSLRRVGPKNAAGLVDESRESLVANLILVWQ